MLRKHWIVVGALALTGTLLVPQVSRAQVLGGTATAAVEEVGAKIVGGYVGITDDFVSLMGQVRYGVTSSFDLGAKAAFVDFEDPAGSSLALNADGRIQLLDVYLQDPVDVALGPEVTYFRSNGVTNWYFGGYLTMSKEFTLSNGQIMTPYGRVGLRFHRVESDFFDDDEFDAGISLGTKYGLTGYTSLWGEVTIEDVGTGVYLGAQYQLR